MPFMNLAELFDWEAEDTLGLYPFEVRCLAASCHPGQYPELLELGRATIDFVYGRSSRVSRQIKAGRVVLYFPERWLSVKEKLGLMNALYDLHTDYPLKSVHIITGEPIFLTDMTDDMIRKWS
jgi:hypothetical protein